VVAMTQAPLYSTIPTHYDERKAAAAAGFFLKYSPDARMKYIRLLKLLYLADREAWKRYGRPITGDEYMAWVRGPVLLATYTLIKAEDEEAPTTTVWHQTVERVGQNDVRLRNEPNYGPLSDAEMEILETVHQENRNTGTWEIVENLHQSLPEWKPPVGWRNEVRPENAIRPETILEVVGRKDKIKDVRADMEELEAFQKLLGAR
jgi:uncharacterized phage-associated protein